MELELRDPVIITAQVTAVREEKASMDAWTLADVLADIKVIVEVLEEEIKKSEKWDLRNKQSLKRIRLYTKTLETLGRKFRVLSVKKDE
jgi:hypothetical protein